MVYKNYGWNFLDMNMLNMGMNINMNMNMITSIGMNINTVKKLLLLVFFLAFSHSAFSKYNVCSITINSSDEINIFKQNLDPDYFHFIELVPLSVKSLPNNAHWFTEACQKGYVCDILVISGHFGGLFFGKQHNYILPVNLMERQSCMNTCQGILSQVQEVFLFGCNTLADKGKDHRTPEEYANILVNEYHMVTDMAQIVAATKYLPFGLSFKEQMQMVFTSPLTTIYGFKSISPLGKNIHRPLNNYFRTINRNYGSYQNYLQNRNPQDYNLAFHNAIGGFVREVKSLSNDHPNFQKFQKICPLYTSRLQTLEGLEIIEELINKGDGAMAYTAIKSFIADRQPFQSGPVINVFNRIKTNSQFRSEFFNLYQQISSLLPYIKIQFLNFLKSFDWIPNKYYLRDLYQYTMGIAQYATSESYDFVSALVYDEHIPVHLLRLNTDDFDQNFYQNIWSALILEALNIQDYRAHRRLMNLCLTTVSKDPVLCYQVMKSLGHLNVSDSLVIKKMEDFLNLQPPHYGLIWYALYGLAYSHVNDEHIHNSIAYHVYNQNIKSEYGQWVQLQAIKTLQFLKIQNATAISQLIKVLKTAYDFKILLATLQTLYQMDHPPLRELRSIISKRNLRNHANPEIRKWTNCFFTNKCPLA